jgi:hypothetical protein
MNFTFTWILDKFGFQPKINDVDFFDLPRPVAKKTTTVAKKPAAKKPAAKKTVRKKS